MSIRPAAVAGSWYPGHPAALTRDLDDYLEAAGPPPAGHVQAIIAPHAGLMFSGPVGAYSYKAAASGSYDVAVLVGPSHFVAFEGVALWPDGAFETPLGAARIDAAGAGAIAKAAVVHRMPSAHTREHSLEMQLPFVRRLAPQARIMALVMGWQTAATSRELGDALVAVLRGRNALIVASTDLSHYYDAGTAARLDAVVIDHVARLDADGLQRALEVRPEHACGGGPTVAVLRAAKQLGADTSVILKYADSGDVSGDKSAVVGYLAAAIGIATA